MDGSSLVSFFFQAEDGIRDKLVTGVQTCALPIFGILALRIDRGHGVARGQRNELYATGTEQGVVNNQKCVSLLVRKARKGRVDVGIGTGRKDFDLFPDD